MGRYIKVENKLQEVSEINKIFLVRKFQNEISRREVLLRMKHLQCQVLSIEGKGPLQLCQRDGCGDVCYRRHENSKRVCKRSQILGNLKIIKSLFTSSTKQVFTADYIGQIG